MLITQLEQQITAIAKNGPDIHVSECVLINVITDSFSRGVQCNVDSEQPVPYERPW